MQKDLRCRNAIDSVISSPLVLCSQEFTLKTHQWNILSAEPTMERPGWFRECSVDCTPPCKRGFFEVVAGLRVRVEV